MQGKVVDFDTIRAQNELVPAVGNMRVNARGDEIAPNGQVLRSRDVVAEESTKAEEKAITSVEEFTEDFGPEPDISPEQAAAILAKNRKTKPQEE